MQHWVWKLNLWILLPTVLICLKFHTSVPVETSHICNMKLKWTNLGIIFFFILSLIMIGCFIWQYRLPKAKPGKRVQNCRTALRKNVFAVHLMPGSPFVSLAFWSPYALMIVCGRKPEDYTKLDIEAHRLLWTVKTEIYLGEGLSRELKHFRMKEYISLMYPISHSHCITFNCKCMWIFYGNRLGWIMWPIVQTASVLLSVSFILE